MSKTIEERLRVLEDREEIIKLKARYVNYNDGGWNGPGTGMRWSRRRCRTGRRYGYWHPSRDRFIRAVPVRG